MNSAGPRRRGARVDRPALRHREQGGKDAGRLRFDSCSAARDPSSIFPAPRGPAGLSDNGATTVCFTVTRDQHVGAPRHDLMRTSGRHRESAVADRHGRTAGDGIDTGAAHRRCLPDGRRVEGSHRVRRGAAQRPIRPCERTVCPGSGVPGSGGHARSIGRARAAGDAHPVGPKSRGVDTVVEAGRPTVPDGAECAGSGTRARGYGGRSARAFTATGRRALLGIRPRSSSDGCRRRPDIRPEHGCRTQPSLHPESNHCRFGADPAARPRRTLRPHPTNRRRVLPPDECR
ncbi:hypothetical protein NG2371_02918 [Nocardia gamkensis]|nr:hypothetical protein [Nocardia gamkensis]